MLKSLVRCYLFSNYDMKVIVNVSSIINDSLDAVILHIATYSLSMVLNI